MKTFRFLFIIACSLMLTACSVVDYGKEKANEIIHDENLREEVKNKALDAADTLKSQLPTSEEIQDKLTEVKDKYYSDERFDIQVTRVKDGDTFVGTDADGNEYTFRLIGVDTPESVAPEEYLEETGKENTEAGDLASEFTKRLIENTTIQVEFDVQKTDKYDRVLVYAWIDQETMVQDVLLKNGYAELATVPPNVKYTARFTAEKLKN